MENFKKALLIRNGNVVGAIGDKYFSTAPLGTVLSYAGQIAPYGYLLCDGANYLVKDYPDLYAVIGNTYGGDSTNFNVPNLVDKFIQGSNTSGIEKEAGLPNIIGEANFRPISDASSVMTDLNTGVFSESNPYTKLSNNKFYSAGTGSQYSSSGVLDFDASKSNAIYGNSDTVQPPALTMVYIIKAFHTNEGTDSGVSDDVVEYVSGEIDKKAAIDDTQTIETSVWSSKKTSDELATKQENMSVRKVYARRNSSTNKYILLSTIDMSKITYIGQPLRIKGVIGNMASNDTANIDLTINARSGFAQRMLCGTITTKGSLSNNANIIITKSDDEKTAYVYLYCISIYGYIDAEIYLGSVHYSVPSTFDLVETMQGTEYTNLLDNAYVVAEVGINDTVSSTISTYSSAKIDKKFAPRHFGTDNKTLYLKLQLGTMTTHEPITVTDQYGGQVKILGMYDLSTYKSVKVIRLSYGDWTTHSGTDFTNTSSGDANYKIRRLFYCPDDNYYYLEIRQYSYISVEGAPDSTMVTSLPVDVSEMTLIPESQFATKKDIDGTTIQTTTITGSEYYAITFKDKQFERGNNQGILIQHNRLNFEPLTFIFSASSYNTAVYERDNYDVTKVNGSVYNPTSPYMMQFYMDKANNTLYLSVPSYSGVTLTDLQFKSDVIVYTKVNVIPSTATKITVTEYVTKADLGSNVPMTEITFTNSTNWSNSSGNLKTFYMVRNGWCFLHVVAHCNKVASDENSVVYSGLPMPPFQVYGKFVGEDNTYEPCNLTVATNGQMLLRGGTVGKDYSFTYTYPVA